MKGRERIDLLLVERGLAESRSQAQRLVMAGQVRVQGELALKPSQMVPLASELTVDRGPRFVSRGGEKLEAALRSFEIEVSGRVCADVGASTGGFTDCLLQHGAARVYAIDVGQGHLHWKLRKDPRVEIMERVNARRLESLPEPIDLVTIDVAFISLRHIFPAAATWLALSGQLLALVKPQFEAGRRRVGKGGVVRSPAVHRQVLEAVMRAADENRLRPRGLMRSPLKGPKGNVEFLLWLSLGGEAASPSSLLDPLLPASAGRA